jgi:hypothetical protein
MNMRPAASAANMVASFVEPITASEVTMRYKQASPWLEFDVSTMQWGVHKFALWISTGAIHEVNHLGAVTDDPIYDFPDRRPLARHPDEEFGMGAS